MKAKRFLLLAMFVGSVGCAPAKPKVICTMQNPQTGERVEMYAESKLKVPAGYNEATHREQWKADQVKKGFTVEVGGLRVVALRD